MNKIYQYKPLRFYSIVFIATWALWFTAAVLGHKTGDTNISPVLMLAGLLAPSVTALCMVLTSKSPALKRELKEKLIGAFRLRPGIILLAIVIFFGVIVEPLVLLIVAAVVVALNRDMFFETRHIGHLLPETDPVQE